MVLLAAMAIAAVFSGCVVFKGPVKAKQIGKKPKVKVTFTLCNSDDDPDPGFSCPDLGNSDDPGDESGSGGAERVLLGFRVPKGTKLPATIAPRAGDAEGQFSEDPSYSQVLNEEAPKGRRFTWKGYRSSQLNIDGCPTPNDPCRFDEARFKVKMKAPKGLLGKKFKFRPVVGWWLSPDFDPEDEIICGSALYERVDDADGNRVCIDSPSPKRVGKSIKVTLDEKNR